MPDALAQWLDEMEARAEKATPGKWAVEQMIGCICNKGPGIGTNEEWVVRTTCDDCIGDDVRLAEENAAHIAAWSPDVARAVLAVVRAASAYERALAALPDGFDWERREAVTVLEGARQDLCAALAALRRIVEGA